MVAATPCFENIPLELPDVFRGQYFLAFVSYLPCWIHERQEQSFSVSCYEDGPFHRQDISPSDLEYVVREIYRSNIGPLVSFPWAARRLVPPPSQCVVTLSKSSQTPTATSLPVEPPNLDVSFLADVLQAGNDRG
jgi:hypothetical protein